MPTGLYQINSRLIGLVLYLTISANTISAQNSSLEFRPETDIWYRLNSSWRLSSFVALTKYYESKTRDLNIYLQGVYAWGQTGKLFIRRLPNEDRAQTMKAWLVRGQVCAGQKNQPGF